MGTETTDDGLLAAGDAAAWLDEVRSALGGDGEADVPCDGCTACCTSGQFVHIAPDERAALARIPAALLAPAPGLPAGHVVLGYDEHGHCPMLDDRGCTIYADRPRTCRVYDCRVFAAAEVRIADPERSAIAARVDRWEFSTPTDDDRAALDAVRRAAARLADHPDETVRGPRRALLAIQLADLFLDGEPEAEAVDAALAATRS